MPHSGSSALLECYDFDVVTMGESLTNPGLINPCPDGKSQAMGPGFSFVNSFKPRSSKADKVNVA